MQGVEYPIKVRVENIELRLQDGTGNGLNERLKSGEEVTISNSAINKIMVSEDVIPTTYSLEQNYPNPFNPSTIISWQSPVDSRQTIKIYDVLGSEVATVIDEFKSAGKYEIKFDASGLSSGIYFYSLQSGSFKETRKMILTK